VKAIRTKQYRRFLSDNPVPYEDAITAAREYAGKLNKDEAAWLYRKPYGSSPENDGTFRLMYSLLNVIEKLQLPTNAHVLEIGSGPGWITRRPQRPHTYDQSAPNP
jgi:hypothetical protein